MLKTIPQYLSTLNDTCGLTKTLGVIDVCTNPDGSPIFFVGNNSVIFRIRHNGVIKKLKCYTRDKRNLRKIYGSKCLHKELYVHSNNFRGEWVDVILDEWVEGVTFHKAIQENLGNKEALRTLADSFDRLALQLLDEPWALGDLKPENIIIKSDGSLQLIDFDAMYLPEFTEEDCEEIGTRAFQHPSRTATFFNKSIDDYSIAIISTALHAMAIDPTLAEQYDTIDQLLFQPAEILAGTSEAYERVVNLFAKEGLAIYYRIALLLRSVTPNLFGLHKLIGYAVNQSTIESQEQTPNKADNLTGDDLELDNLNGLWGYRRGDKFVIPPVYNLGFDFSEGVAAVTLGDQHFYLDPAGHIALKCPNFSAIKSFRNGEAIVIEDGVRKRIDHAGNILGVEPKR